MRRPLLPLLLLMTPSLIAQPQIRDIRYGGVHAFLVLPGPAARGLR